MTDHIRKRVIASAKYMIENNTTIQETAEKFGVSQSTTHFDVRHRIKKIDPILQKKVGVVIDRNILDGKFKGGIAASHKNQVGEIPEEVSMGSIDTETQSHKSANNQSLKILGTGLVTMSATLLILNKKNKQRKRSRSIWG